MGNHAHPSVIFLRVTDATTKIRRIISTVHQHFLSGDRVIVFSPNQKAAEYIDSLLWRDPSESFLPHRISNEPNSELVVITQSNSNINNARVALNLTPNICPGYEEYEQIYELYDQTDAQKAEFSKKKMEEYKHLGLLSP